MSEKPYLDLDEVISNLSDRDPELYKLVVKQAEEQGIPQREVLKRALHRFLEEAADS